jgi:hypothetical protein
MKQLSETSTPLKNSGYLLPWNSDENFPCLINIESIPFIPLFSDEEKIKAHLEFTKYSYNVTIKFVTDTDDFLESVQSSYRVALDPRPTERNTTRFTELKLT